MPRYRDIFGADIIAVDLKLPAGGSPAQAAECAQCGNRMGRWARPTPIVGRPGVVVCGPQCVHRFRAHQRYMRRDRLGILTLWERPDPPHALEGTT